MEKICSMLSKAHVFESDMLLSFNFTLGQIDPFGMTGSHVPRFVMLDSNCGKISPYLGIFFLEVLDTRFFSFLKCDTSGKSLSDDDAFRLMLIGLFDCDDDDVSGNVELKFVRLFLPRQSISKVSSGSFFLEKLFHFLPMIRVI